MKTYVSVIDDDKDISTLFKAFLTGYWRVNVVSFFIDPIIGSKHFADNKKCYALVISDLRMPNLNGLELLKRVKDKNPKVRTVLISAFEVESDPIFKQYIQDGIIDNFMKKPIRINSFCSEVSDQMHDFRKTANM